MTKHYKYKRLISGALIAGLLIYFSYTQWKGSSEEEMMAPPTVLVSTAPVIIEDTPLIINVFGSLRAVDSVDITSEIDGTITELFFIPGQSMQAGDPLIRLDDSEQQAMHAQAAAELELSTAEYKRLESLLQKNAVSAQEVDKAKATLDISAAQLKIATAHLEKTLIKAPFAGVIGAKKLSLGQYVMMGTPLVELVDRSQLILEYNVSEQFLNQVAIGQTIELSTSAYPSQTFSGTVNFIAPQLNVTTRTLAVEALIDNSDGRLSPGLSVKLSHVLGHQKNGMKIPEESLIPTVEGYKVYIVQEGVANSVTVEIESRAKGFVYVKGLSPDAIVITRGQEKLREGAKVEILNKQQEV